MAENMSEVNRIKCPKCGSASVIYYGNDLYGCCNLECEYKWKIPSIVGEYEIRI